jgi:dihydroorotate dehydrogenase (fumarate)
MIDLSTEYLGLKLQNPLVASSSPLTKDLANLKRLEDAGAAAVVLPSLFEEQIAGEAEALDQVLRQGSEISAEAQSYFPDFQSYGIGPKAYLESIQRAKKALGIPVIGSLNGVSPGVWIHYAREMEQAGADALELNVYFLATRLDVDSQEIEQRYCDLVQDLKAQVRIPVAVKLGPYFTSMANMAHRLDRAGADALVLFNRFYQPDFDLEALEVTPNLKLSTSDELRLRLHWVALLSARIRPDLAITGGVHTAEDVVKGIMAGAKAVMLTSALLRHGISYLSELEGRLVEWMGEHEYESIRQMRGALNASAAAQPEVFARANYLKVLGSYNVEAAHLRRD